MISDDDELLKDLGEFINDEDEALMSPIAQDLKVPLEPTFQEHQLDRSLGLCSGVWIIVASSVGSGIFASPGIVFGYTKSIGASLLIWILAGLLSITGALCYAELGAMMPVSGGEFNYLLRAYGSLPAFLFSFSNIILSRPVSTAILSLTFAQYLAKLFDSSSSILIKFIAILAILCISVVNILSTKGAVYAQDFLAALKMMGLVIISFFGILFMFTKSTQLPTYWFNTASTSLGDYALATYSALWAYDGWNSLNLVSEELKNPRDNLPKAVVAGPCIVMISYVLTNLGYFVVLEPSHLQYSRAIAIDFGIVVLGQDFGRFIFTLIVSLACLSAAHANIFSGSRIIWNSARNNEIPKIFSQVHERFGSPHYAILLLCLQSIVIVLIGDIYSLMTLNGMIAIPFYFLSALGVIVLRFKEPTILRPFKNWIIVPVIFSAAAFFVLLFGAYSLPFQAFISILTMLIGTFLWMIDHKMLLTMKSQLISFSTLFKSRLFSRKEYVHATSDNLEMDRYAE